MKKYNIDDVKEFLRESNAIEGVYTNLGDSLLAYEYIITQDKLTIPVILNCHRLIIENLNPRIAGKLRTCEVSVGGRNGYPAHTIKESLESWLVEANSVSIDKKIKENHILFEFIHPFEDGNGRTGRLIYLWQRAKSHLPMEIIFNDRKHLYYKWFK